MPPVTGSRPAFSLPTGVTARASAADFLDEKEIEAAGVVRIRDEEIVVVAIAAGQWGALLQLGQASYLVAL